MASSTASLLDDALRRDAIAALQRATDQPHKTTSRSLVVAVDSTLHVVLEVLAFGAGGKLLYDDLHITRLVAVDTTTAVDGAALRRQVGLDRANESNGNNGTARRWPDHTIAFILPPLPATAQLLAQALAPFLEAEASIACTVLWQPAATAACALEMERHGLVGVVRQHNLSLGLLPVDRHVAALCDDRVFAELYVHGQYHALTRVVRSILAVDNSIGHVTCHGPFATRVKTMLEMAQRLPSRPAATVPRRRHIPFERLILLDRMEDPLSMLLTPMTYEGLLDALIGMNHGVVSVDKPVTTAADSESDDTAVARDNNETTRVKILLNHRDELFDVLRDENINTLMTHRLPELAEELVTETRAGRNEDASPAASTSATSIAQIRAQLRNVPYLLNKKRSLAHHLALVDQIQQRSQHLGLRTCVEAELAILRNVRKRGLRNIGSVSTSGASDDIDRILEEALLRDDPNVLDVYDVLKLLCLQSLVSGGLKEDRLQWFRQQLCHSYGHDVLPLLAQLEQLELLSPTNKFDYPRRRKELSLMHNVVVDDADTTSISARRDIHFMFPYTGYAPMSVRLVQTTLGMKIKKPSKDVGSLFSTSSSASIQSNSSTGSMPSTTSTNSTDRDDRLTGPRRSVLVYFLGGVTVAELAAFRWLNATQHELEFFVATTAICNGTRLLRAM